MASLQYFDCHNHIYCEDFDHDRDEIVAEASEHGVKGMISVTESFHDVPLLLKMIADHPQYCYAGLGVHPVQKEGTKDRSATQEDLDKMLPFIHQHLDKLVCIGEVGLDFTPRVCSTDNAKDSQRLVFSEQIKLAENHNLPLNVHSRSAGRPVIKLLKEMNARNVLLHAFDGKVSVALEGAQCGFYFSIPPSIIRSEQKDKIVKALPLDKILLETDSPALGPEKLVRNKPSNIQISCEYIAKTKNCDVEVVSNILMENTFKLFSRIARIPSV